MDDISFLPAHELARLIRLKKISCVESIGLHLQRIEALNPSLNAFVSVDAKGVLGAAQAADESIAVGGDLPPLLGMPISIKSCIDVAGTRVEAGSRLRAGLVAEHDAVVSDLSRRRAPRKAALDSCRWHG